MDANLEQFYQPNSDGNPIPNKAALMSATDDEYFAVMTDAETRLRPRKNGDAKPIFAEPTGMKTHVFVDREGTTLAMYFVDARIRFNPGVSAMEVLLSTPAKWSALTSHHVGVTAGVLPSILVPFIPN